ncbi:MAG: CHASE2 domain-containing protein [Candidatus Omnitrophica bacterium]|nr:CHASE2 domain-containing protein [Candidatus Omnitrophota bacterium]
MNFFKRTPLKFWIIIAAVILITVSTYIRLFDGLELVSYDLRLKFRPPQAISKDIVIVEIDDVTLEQLGSWPLPRDYHADVLRILKESGAKAVAFDILFSEKSDSTAGVDAAFAQAIAASGNIYLPVALDIKEKQERSYDPLESNAFSAGIFPDFMQAIHGSGHINTFTDIDGKIRRIPLFIAYENTFVPQLALKVACDVLGIDTRTPEFKGRRVNIDKKISLPISSHASFMVNYPDRWTKSFIHFSYAQIIAAYRDTMQGKAPAYDLSLLKDKICFIGLTATGTHDLKAMPFEKAYPMLGLQASVCNSILNKKFIVEVDPLVNIGIIILIFLGSLAVCLYFNPLRALVETCIISVSYFCIAAALLIFLGLWINLFLPLLVIALTYIAATLYKFISEIHKRQLLEKELDIARAIQKSFLPKDIQEHPAIGITTFMQPAKFVGGDLYDIVTLPNKRLGVFIGDVSGKGVPAALIMAQTVSLFRVFARVNDNPSQVLAQINRELCQVLEGRFVTALYLIFDAEKNVLEASCAGHLPILALQRGGQVSEVLPVAGPPLGILDQVEYETFQVSLAKDDKFLLYTDGITEARDRKGEEFGMERLKEVFSRNVSLSKEKALNHITAKLFEFSKGPAQFDDITAILLEYRR